MTRGTQFDESVFHPQRVLAVRHTWADHPLLQLDALKRLSERLTTVERGEQALALHDIQGDAEYRGLVDEVLDEVGPRIAKKDPGMHGRAANIVVAAPNAALPYGLEHEHSFVLQCQGKAKVCVWEPLDREVVTERCLEVFHAKGSRDLVSYRNDLLPRAHALTLEPGTGVYRPSTAPHLVKNGDAVSITLSVTYYSRAIRETKLLYRSNHTLRELGLAPHPIGEPGLRGRLRDQAKLAAALAQQQAKLARKRQLLNLTSPKYATAGAID